MTKKLSKAQRMVLLMADKGQVFWRESQRLNKPGYWIGGRKDVIERLISCGLLKHTSIVGTSSVWTDIHPVALTEKGRLALKEGEYDA